MKALTFMLIAGEASGDLLAAELVHSLKHSPEVRAMPFPPEFFGAGGPQMAAAGVELAFDLTQHSVVGISDVLKKYWEFARSFARLVKLARERKPDIIICVDFQAFNRRLAHAVRKYVRARQATFNNWNPRIVQYVSPQVWASRPGRAFQLAEDVDLLLSIIPFERGWYARRVPKLRVKFVGNPVVDRFQKAAVGARKSDASSILLLPGSRKDELRRHLPVLVDAARLIRQQNASFRFKMVLPSEDLRLSTDESLAQLPGLQVQVGGLSDLLTEANLAITKSGTITLECALFNLPAVVFYKTSWPTYLISRPMIDAKYIAMPNLLADEAVYPELIQGAATGENIAREALDLLVNSERRRIVKTKLEAVVKSLGVSGASQRAAQAILSLP